VTVSGEGLRDPRAAERLGLGLALLTVLWAGVLHHGLGPSFRRKSFLEPSSFLLGDVPGTLLPALAVLVLPSFALAVAVAFLSRSALTRTAAGIATIASACFVFYGLEAAGVWRFFHWRWSVSVLLFALLVGGAIHAPLLAERWRRLGWPLRLATYLPIFACLIGYERNVTGTNPELPLAISPWPVVQILGLELAASAIAALELGVGVGLFGLARGVLPAAFGALAAIGLPLASLAAGSASGLLPFHAGPILFGATAVPCVLVLAACALWPPRERGAWTRRASNALLGGLLLGLPLVAGQALTRLDYSATRDDRAQQIIDALARHGEQSSGYPDRLEDLVVAGLLPEVPRPRIGFFSRQEFVYQNFGDSYLLEFSAPRWIQCAYNPPWKLAPGEEIEEEDADALVGAWSCPQKPPELW
jgi:hypothetical protein